MVKYKIYPTSLKKYLYCGIREISKTSFTVWINTAKYLPKRVNQMRIGFVTYEEALRYMRTQSEEYKLPIQNMIYDRGTHCECLLTRHGNNHVMKFDKEDIDKVQQHLIHAQPSKCDVYAVTTIPGKDGKIGKHGQNVRFHDIIMNHDRSLDKTLTVDHIVPGDTLDNRKKNLRLATLREQAINHRINRRNTSGYKGVSRDKHLNAWVAQCAHESGKKIRKSFACKMFGENEAKQMAIDWRSKMENKFDDYRNFMPHDM